MITTSDSLPKFKITEGNITRIFFDFKEIVVKDFENGNDRVAYQGENVDVIGNADYGSIASAIVKDKYPSDVKDAVQANYELAKEADSPLSEEKRAEYLKEYEDYQAWRIKAKEVAKRVLNDDNSTE
ncbi:hypothetical protein [Bacteroides sp.]|uniref:hypothetical protein n=1 Tax=Bacteroides sp. TaxID=29523 RepID=UPI002627CE28|nr:hypothetical protein [Bacteroides sp.]MDD3040311.1 hypothetical protein [Bacteroides sp.]